MQFALFYEIPVARPWTRTSEHEAYKAVLEQAVLGEQAGFTASGRSSTLLEEFSHCSNPEVLYGAIAAKTSRLRLGTAFGSWPSLQPPDPIGGVRGRPRPALGTGASSSAQAGRRRARGAGRLGIDPHRRASSGKRRST